MRIVAFIMQAAPVARILTRIGEPPMPPQISWDRGPPDWGDPAMEAVPARNVLAQPQSEYVLARQAQRQRPPIVAIRWRR